MLLNSHEPGAGRSESDIQATRFDVTIEREPLSLPDSSDPVVTKELFDRSMLPALSSVELSRSEEGYRLELDAHFTDLCHAEQDLRALFVETPTGVSDRTGQPVVDWLFVSHRRVSKCPEEKRTPTTKRLMQSRSVRSDYVRKFVIVNPIRGLDVLTKSSLPFAEWDVPN